MSLSGVLSGSDVFLRVKTGSQWLTIGGQLSHSQTQNVSPIDITCKQGSGWRDIMSGQGLQTMDVSSELIFSSDAAFDYVKTSALSKSIELFQVVRGSLTGSADNVDEFNAMITSFAETSPDNDKHTASVSFISSGAWFNGISFSQFLTVGGDTFKTSDSDLFLVRN